MFDYDVFMTGMWNVGSKPMWEGVAGCTMDGHITHLNLKSIGLAGTVLIIRVRDTVISAR